MYFAKDFGIVKMNYLLMFTCIEKETFVEDPLEMRDVNERTRIKFVLTDRTGNRVL